MSSHWYEAVIEKCGTVENFIDQLCEKQGLTKEYLESDVETYEDQQDYWDKDDEYGVKINTEALVPFLTSVSNVYKYDSMEELDLIVKALDEPIVDGVGCSWDKDYKKGLSKSYGLLFFWSEYDDFSCGDPFTPYCKIIDGGIVQ